MKQSDNVFERAVHQAAESIPGRKQALLKAVMPGGRPYGKRALSPAEQAEYYRAQSADKQRALWEQWTPEERQAQLDAFTSVARRQGGG